MSENSPLLSESRGPTRPHEHPIFLRVVHSPWTFVGQKVLLLFRTAVAAYMAVVLACSLDAEINGGGNGALFPFYMGYVSYALQLVYFSMTSLWTFQHFVAPRNRPQRESWNIVDRTLSFISIPRTTEFTAAKRYAFSVIYASAMTFPLVVSFLHWFVLARVGAELGGAELGSGHGKTDWLISSLFIVNSVVAFVEMALLSSIRKIKPFIDHVVALASITGLYFAWAQLGHVITGVWTYAQVNSDVLTSSAMFVNVVTAMALTTSTFLTVLFLHEARDMLAKKAECDRSL